MSTTASLHKNDVVPPANAQALPHRILYVEDDDGLADLFEQFFETEGAPLSRYATADSAWEAFSKTPDSWDVLLTDLNLPGMSGFDLVQLIKERRPELPVVVVSGFLDERQIDRLYDLKVDDFFHKPVNFKNLADRLSEMPKAG